MEDPRCREHQSKLGLFSCKSDIWQQVWQACRVMSSQWDRIGTNYSLSLPARMLEAVNEGTEYTTYRMFPWDSRRMWQKQDICRCREGLGACLEGGHFCGESLMRKTMWGSLLWKDEVVYYRLALLSALPWGLANGCSHRPNTRPDTRVDYSLCSNHCS